MKKRKFSVQAFLSGVLGILGFAGCDNIIDTSMEYGTPTVDYRVKGEVKDEFGKPLQGIQVIVADDGIQKLDEEINKYGVKGDTVYTDGQGKFESAKIKTFGLYKQEVSFNDVDGEANGGDFQSLKLKVDDLEKKQINKGSSWYAGEYELKANVNLVLY